MTKIIDINKPLRFIVLVCSTIIFNTATSAELVFATGDRDNYPWKFIDGRGADTKLIETAAINLGHTAKIVYLPWKRCLANMKNSLVDGCYAASFKEERLEDGVYPMSNGQHDDTKQIHSSSYSLYVRTDSTVDWDGESFLNLEGGIGVNVGYSIISKIKNTGAPIVEVSSTENMFKMLIAERLDGVAGLTPESDYILINNLKFATKIRKVEIPLQFKPYYLMFSHKMNKNSPDLVNAFYKEIEKIRDSNKYKTIYENALLK